MKECCEMKGFLSFMVLKLISKKNMSGDEIREELKKRRGSRPSPGTIYPALKGLKESGFIEEKKDGKIIKYTLTKEPQMDVLTVPIRPLLSPPEATLHHLHVRRIASQPLVFLSKLP